MKKKVFIILLTTMLIVTACGSTKAPTEPSGSREVSASVQEEAKTPEPTQKPAETSKQVVVATAAPTEEPKAEPTPESTPEPTPEPTVVPVESTVPEPTATQAVTTSPEPTVAPTMAPKETAAPKETVKPEVVATAAPTEEPKAEPTPEPTPEPVHTCSFDDGKVTERATCNSEGTITYSCSCGATRTESISKTSHNYVTQTTEATCTADGYTQEVCTNCGDTKGGSSIGALGHDYEKNVTMGKTTCTSGAYYVIQCSRCGDVTDSGNEDYLPHDYEETVISEGDCVTVSVIECTCKVCGHSYRTEGEPMGDHQWVTKEVIIKEWSEELQDIIERTETQTRCSRCNMDKE